MTQEIQQFIGYMQSPIGTIEIQTSDEWLESVRFVEEKPEIEPAINHPILQETIRQLTEYFEGTRTTFDLPIAWQGTLFQQSVLRCVAAIPYGMTASYKNIAGRIENEKAVRAVGTSNRNNRLLIVIPCHRVIASNGSLSGYAGGVWRKEWLLNHEKTHCKHIFLVH